MCEKMTDLVMIQMMPEDSHQIGALFSSTGVPSEATFTMENGDSLNSKNLVALDQISGQQYSGVPENRSEYYIGIRNSDKLEIHPLSMYRMNPMIELNERHCYQFATPLTKKEQMDEMKEKFGSRKIQRSLASKRKYAIEFGEEDAEQLDTKTRMIAESVVSQSANQRTINDSLDILPKQNRDAISVQEVYDLNEIIPESERLILTQFEDQLFGQIDNIFIQQLISNPNESTNKLIAIYINLIISLINLKNSDLRKLDPLPKLIPEVKDMLFNRYMTTQVVNRKTKYLLSPKEKDRLLIYGIILCLILHNYRPIDLESLQKAFKIPLKQFRKIVEIIGAYVENLKNSAGVNTKAIVFRVPLNTFNEKKTFKRR